MLTGRGSSAGNSERNTKNADGGSRSNWLSSRIRTQISSHVKNDAFKMRKSKGTKGDLDSESESSGQMGRSNFNTSQDHILENGDRKGGFGSETVLEINRDVTFTVEHSRNETMDDRNPRGGYKTNVHGGSKHGILS